MHYSLIYSGIYYLIEYAYIYRYEQVNVDFHNVQSRDLRAVHGNVQLYVVKLKLNTIFTVK